MPPRGCGTRRPFLWTGPRGPVLATYPDGSGRRSPAGANSGASSLFGLAPGGACHAVPVAGSAVGSYPTLSSLPPVRARVWRFAFCGAIPGVAPGGCYPPPFHRGARTFLSHLATRATARPSDPRVRVWPMGMKVKRPGWSTVPRWSPGENAQTGNVAEIVRVLSDEGGAMGQRLSSDHPIEELAPRIAR